MRFDIFFSQRVAEPGTKNYIRVRIELFEGKTVLIRFLPYVYEMQDALRKRGQFARNREQEENGTDCSCGGPE